ncbi:MAG: cell cycle transcriptional regulator TrcR [Alphaproteobacteria bacterium]
MVGKILMPKATAVWLIDNTALTFEQIADFCGMHALEVQALADRESTDYIVGLSPVLNGMLSKEDIAKCEADPKARLVLNKHSEEFIKKSHDVKSRYTPMAHRQNRPDAILWLVKNHPDITDAQICKLVRTTKATVESIRERTHKNIAEITPRSPVLLGICSEFDLRKTIDDAEKKAVAAEKKAAKMAKKVKKED